MKNSWEEAPQEKNTVTRVLMGLLVIALALALLCFAVPTIRKREMLSSVGEELQEKIELIPAILSYYDGSAIATLAKNPADAVSYRTVSEGLGVICESGAFDSVLLIAQSGKQYVCAADGLLGSNANVYGAASLLSLDKAMTGALDDLFAGGTGGTVNDLTAARMGGDAVCVVLPVVGSDGSVLAALAIQQGVGETTHNLLFGINLYAVGGVFWGIALLLAFLLYLTKKLRQHREEKAAAEADLDFPPKPPVEKAPQEAAAPEKTEKAAEEMPKPSLTLPEEEGNHDKP